MVNSAPIKIAFFTGSFQFGGTERYLLNLLENIDRQLFHPTIMCFDKSGGFYSEFQICLSLDPSNIFVYLEQRSHFLELDRQPNIFPDYQYH